MVRKFDVTTETSRRMAAVAQSGTGPELLLQLMLREAGIADFEANAALPGSPDLYFQRANLAVFVDGCFWHACPLHTKPIKRNSEFWEKKRRVNREKDERNSLDLQRSGLRVLRFWEHELKDCPEAVIEEIWLALNEAHLVE